MRTGVFRKSDTENLGVAAALLALAENAPGATAQVVHLTSNKVTSLSLSTLVLDRRRDALRAAMEDIRAGRFPTDPSQRVCPSCPAFFVCGPVPAGALQKDF